MDENIYRTWMEEISSPNMRRHLEEICSYEKLSGEPDALRAAKYIEKELKTQGIKCEMLTFPAYLSNPGEGCLEVEGAVYRARPRSFSGCCKELEAELIFDEDSERGGATELEKETFYQQVRGKIVVAYGYDERYGKILEAHGAAAWIQVWKSDELLIHEDTVAPVWGTPDMDSRFLILQMPVVGVNRKTGQALEGRIKAGPVRARLTAHADCHVKDVALPVAHIQGASKEFVLLSCHYDTWYEGAFDNCTANAAALEIARVLKLHEKELRRSVRIAWWPGHSNGRYMGSTWYCDHYFGDLYRDCVACLNSDLIGVSGVDMMGIKTAFTEGEAFLRELLDRAAPGLEIGIQAVGRGADQSFFGADIPYHINPRMEAKHRLCATAGPGKEFWHTQEDTFDKIDFENLQKDAGFLGLLTFAMVCQEHLPLDVDGYFALWAQRLHAVEEQAEEPGCLSEVADQLQRVKEAVQAALSRCGSAQEETAVIKQVFGTLNRLFHSSGSAYEQDTAFAYAPLHLLGESARVKKSESPKELWLFSHTTFVRQKNRMLTETEKLLRQLS